MNHFDQTMTTPAGMVIPVITLDEASICKHCRRPIEFLDFGYVHSDTVWADCAVVVADRRVVHLSAEIRYSIDPTWRLKGATCAEPAGN